ncbi:NADH dehydrogenase iron-sulfur protein [Striga asiatica]|uniref:NADH dehydrogenase iron-sulfur protein n=1 Tax=Striga asiatica TaxID=4170 RepID=A0A5A7QBZ4_STRAF|nr:NADH dehydrogenase iron-sulfur protein [Striga asiatica]
MALLVPSPEILSLVGAGSPARIYLRKRKIEIRVSKKRKAETVRPMVRPTWLSLTSLNSKFGTVSNSMANTWLEALPTIVELKRPRYSQPEGRSLDGEIYCKYTETEIIEFES